MARDWHTQAMDYVEQAQVAQMLGDAEAELSLLNKALFYEWSASQEAGPEEPTRSVLHRSAATLAIRCQNWMLARKIAVRGLTGNPPDEIADELREVLEQADKGEA